MFNFNIKKKHKFVLNKRNELCKLITCSPFYLNNQNFKI